MAKGAICYLMRMVEKWQQQIRSECYTALTAVEQRHYGLCRLNVEWLLELCM